MLEETRRELLALLKRVDGRGAPGVMLSGVASTLCASEMKLVSKLFHSLWRLEGKFVSHAWVGMLIADVSRATSTPTLPVA